MTFTPSPEDKNMKWKPSQEGKCCEKCGRTSDVVDMSKCPFCHKPEPQTESWEREFEQIVRPFGAKGIVALVPEINASCECWVLQQIERPIKSFISSLLSSAVEKERERVVRLCEGMKWKPRSNPDDRADCYNQALSDIISAVTTK